MDVAACSEDGSPRPRSDIDADVRGKKMAEKELVDAFGKGLGAPLSPAEVRMMSVDVLCIELLP